MSKSRTNLDPATGAGSPTAPEADSGEPRTPGSDGGEAREGQPAAVGRPERSAAVVEGDDVHSAAMAAQPAGSTDPAGSRLTSGQIGKAYYVYNDENAIVGLKVMVQMGSPLNQALEDAWMDYLEGIEGAFSGRVVTDFFVGPHWSFTDRIQWTVLDISEAAARLDKSVGEILGRATAEEREIQFYPGLFLEDWRPEDSS